MSEKGSNNNVFIYLTKSFDFKMKPGVATDLDLLRFFFFLFLPPAPRLRRLPLAHFNLLASFSLNSGEECSQSMKITSSSRNAAARAQLQLLEVCLNLLDLKSDSASFHE